MNSKKLFFIVDDDPDDRDFFYEAIGDIPEAECFHAVDGEDALCKLRNLKENLPLPDYIFMDLNMPRMDGWTCLAELKKDARFMHIPVIIFSTSSAQKDKDNSQKLGAVHFITKPTDFKKLCSEIIFIMQADWSLKEQDTH